MKKFVLIFLLFVSVTYAQNTFFQIVESVPKETTMEQSRLPRTQAIWLNMINNAKSTLDIGMFYFANKKGEALEPVMDAIKSAAARGVIVRILVDSAFYAGSEKSVDEFNGINNITVAKISFKNVGGGVMHAKYMIADGRDLYTGSANMDWRALDHIHELGIRIKNRKLAKNFEAIFNYDWNNSDAGRNTIIGSYISFDEVLNSYKELSINTNNYGGMTLYPCFSPMGKLPEGFSNELEELMNIINNAKHSLHIQMYAYNTREEFTNIDKALRDAAERGVKIKIIFGNWAIRKGATEVIQSLSQVPNIEVKFSAIPEHSGGFIPYARVEHCKYFIADNNISWVSSANWERGYFYGTRNATLVIDNKKVNKVLKKVFMFDWNSQYTETVDPNKTYEPVKRN
jgi:phosphatidylserine/phosphatidylglycerophosphate/cardiolipin synthase-like enzyme